MEKPSYQCVAMDNNIPTDEKQQGMSSPAIVLSPIWKLTPGNHSGKRSSSSSNLYDSYELQAVTKQLNRAIRGSKSPLSPYSYYMKSSKRMNCIFRNNAATTTKRISGPQLNAATATHHHDLNMNEKGNRGIVLRLWKKIKYGLTRSISAK